jgi:hypothetical protein
LWRAKRASPRQAAPRRAMVKGPSKEKWIQGAVKHPGKFTNYCNRTGSKGVTKACISRGMHSRNSTTRHEALFAQNMRKIAARHHH